MNYSFIKDRHNNHYKNLLSNNSLQKGYVLLCDCIQKVVYLHQIN